MDKKITPSKKRTRIFPWYHLSSSISYGIDLDGCNYTPVL